MFNIGPAFFAADSPGPPPAVNRVLLLHFDGANGQQTTVDSSNSAHPVTMTGALALTTAWSRFGPSSVGNFSDGAKITIPTSDDWVVPNVFTFQCWIQTPASGWSEGTLFNIGMYTSGIFIRLTNNSNADIYIVGSGFSPTFTALSVNTVYHIAVTRDSSGTVYFFIDGFLIATQSMTAPVLSGLSVIIGQSAHNVTEHWPGNIDEMAFDRNCLWTASFTPPTAALGP